MLASARDPGSLFSQPVRHAKRWGSGASRAAFHVGSTASKFDWRELDRQLSDQDSLQAHMFNGYRHLLTVRIRQPAFHPDGAQTACDHDDPVTCGVPAQPALTVLSGSWCRPIVERRGASVDLSRARFVTSRTGRAATPSTDLSADPYQVAWLEAGTSVESLSRQRRARNYAR